MAVPLRGEADVLSARKIAGFAKSHGVQILHAHTGHAHMIACLARRFAPALKVLVSRRVDFRPSSNWFSRYKYGLPDHYIAISSAIGRVLADAGVPSSKISVVHSGINVNRLDVTPRTRAELGLPTEGPLIGNVAALVGHKDHRTLIGAMPAVLTAFPKAQLAIVGEGKLRADLEERIETLNLSKRVHLLGYRTDVPAVLKVLDVFAMSSVEEGLGTSVLDAMASGVPVAATDAGGIPEMVRNGMTGLLVPARDSVRLAEAIVSLLTDRALAARLSVNAAEMVSKEFSADAMVEGNIAVYERLLGGS